MGGYRGDANNTAVIPGLVPGIHSWGQSNRDAAAIKSTRIAIAVVLHRFHP